MTFQHVCGILFVRTESLGPAHTQKEGSTQDMNVRKLGSLGSSLDAA